MAIIYRHEPAKLWTSEYDKLSGRNIYKDVLCPACGSHMIKWDSGGYSASHTECFSETCLALKGGSMNIALIRGDVREFDDKDYAIANGSKVHYTSAKEGGYSEELRNAVKSVLEDWGYTHITFVEPDGKDKSESDTVVRGIHKSPLVNVSLREVPRPQRSTTFNNKFGVITLTHGFTESHEKHYRNWSHITHEISQYYSSVNGTDSCLYPKNIVLNVRRKLQKESDSQELLAKKRSALALVEGCRSNMQKHQRYVNSYREDMEKYIAKYEETFGEPCPKK